MFAIDGVKLPSNASKAKSGTPADFLHQAEKLEAAAKTMLARHRENDTLPVEPDLAEKAYRRIERLDQEAAQLRQWLTEHPENRRGRKSTIRKSKRTDPDSAKMATAKGVIQGYCGVAAVDDAHYEAQAHGTESEQELLLPVVKATAALRTDQTLITADAGYHSETNFKALAEENIPALIADNGMRKRDERFRDQEKYKAFPDPLYDKAHPKKSAKTYRPNDFTYDPAPEPASARRARCSIRTARTASTTVTFQPSSRAPYATACPVINAKSACAPERKPKSDRSVSSEARRIQRK